MRNKKSDTFFSSVLQDGDGLVSSSSPSSFSYFSIVSSAFSLPFSIASSAIQLLFLLHLPPHARLLPFLHHLHLVLHQRSDLELLNGFSVTCISSNCYS